MNIQMLVLCLPAVPVGFLRVSRPTVFLRAEALSQHGRWVRRRQGCAHQNGGASSLVLWLFLYSVTWLSGVQWVLCSLCAQSENEPCSAPNSTGKRTHPTHIHQKENKDRVLSVIHNQNYFLPASQCVCVYAWCVWQKLQYCFYWYSF